MRTEQTISTSALCLVALFALATVATLGGLLYKIRVRGRAAEPAAVAQLEIVPRLQAGAQLADPLLRIVPRNAEDPVDVPLIVARPDAAPEEATAALPEPAPVAEPSTPPAPITPRAATPGDGNDNLIPEVSGPSYTTKKMLSGGIDPNAGRPGAKRPKNPALPKPPPAVVPAKPAVKPEPLKPALPTLPPLPAAGEGSIDFSKVPIYVLTDGRRIRALVAKEINGQVSIRNEAGTLITFKKADVKEVLRN